MKGRKNEDFLHSIDMGGAYGLVAKINVHGPAACVNVCVMVAKPSARYARKVHGRRREYQSTTCQDKRTREFIYVHCFGIRRSTYCYYCTAPSMMRDGPCILAPSYVVYLAEKALDSFRLLPVYRIAKIPLHLQCSIFETQRMP